ncbi:MAG: hypothetical protein LBQ60_13940 [Bacteroidales bacterium]|nr:hypothetical protein [Bacteroidales bacterium]
MIHIAFEVSSRTGVDARAKEFMDAGLPILKGQRGTDMMNLRHLIQTIIKSK